MSMLALCLILCSGLLFCLSRFNSSRLPPFPPGPKPLPLVGNLFEFPASKWWLKFSKLQKLYGSLVYLKVFNKHIIIINDYKTAKDLLEKTATAHRPRFVMAGELMGFGPSIVLSDYGERWRTCRRIANQVLSSVASRQYFTMQEEEARRLVKSLLQKPEEFASETRFSLMRFVMLAIYGIECQCPNDNYIEVAEETLDNVTKAVIPGSYFVDIFPGLRYLPYMGLNFQKKIKVAKSHVDLMVRRPFEHVLRDRLNGVFRSSFVSSLLDGEIQLKNEEHRVDIISWTAATLYAASGETLLTTMLNFFLAMALYPEVQQRAHEELDRVVGREKWPTFEDRECLPYIVAIGKELLRWRVVVPSGIPHKSDEDMHYNGYLIPKDSILIYNSWSMISDARAFENAKEFNPTRFLNGECPIDPASVAFGFGPRSCPGKHIAINQIYIMVSSILWAFNIRTPEEQPFVEPDYSSGFVSGPSEFPCVITPRKEMSPGLFSADGM